MEKTDTDYFVIGLTRKLMAVEAVDAGRPDLAERYHAEAADALNRIGRDHHD